MCFLWHCLHPVNFCTCRQVLRRHTVMQPIMKLANSTYHSDADLDALIELYDAHSVLPDLMGGLALIIPSEKFRTFFDH